MVNVCGENHAKWLQDVPNRIQEAVLHGVRSGAVNALAAAQLRHGAQLLESVTSNFIEESNDKGFQELMEEFTPLCRYNGVVLIGQRHHRPCLL